MKHETEKKLTLGKARAIFVRGFHRFWWLALILMISLSAIAGIGRYKSYVPKYTASVTFTVYVKNPNLAAVTSYNQQTASQLAKTFPYILTSGVLVDKIRDDIGGRVPGISVSSIDKANLLVLKVRDSDPEYAYKVLQSVIKVYPQVAEFVVGPTELSIIDESGIPTEADSALSWIGAAEGGAAMGLLIGFAVMMAYGITKVTVDGREDLQSISNVKYIGSLPKLVQKKRSDKTIKNISVEEIKDMGYREAVRSVAVRVDKQLKQQGIKSVMICSAISGEGKTTVAYNLALSLSKLKRKVLLIDCDLRNPSMYRMMGIEKCPGVSELMRGTAKPDEVLHPIKPGKFDIIYAGEDCSGMLDFIGTDLLGRHIDYFRDRYDYVLLDTPPCSILSDAEELADVVDTAIMVIRQNYASRASIVEGLLRISDGGVPVSGYILNVYTSTIRDGYGYGHGYSYGYGYGYGYGSNYGYYGDHDKDESKK